METMQQERYRLTGLSMLELQAEIDDVFKEQLETTPALFPSDVSSSTNSAEAVSLSVSLRMLQPTLHVYGPLGSRLNTPGIALLRLATCLGELGVERGAAWQGARLDQPEAVVVAQSRGEWPERARSHAQEAVKRYEGTELLRAARE